MATALVTLPTGTNTTLAPAVAGKIIRVKRILCSEGFDAALKSGSTPISPSLKCGPNSYVDVRWDGEAMQCARGEALVAYSDALSVTDAWIEYELVD